MEGNGYPGVPGPWPALLRRVMPAHRLPPLSVFCLDHRSYAAHRCPLGAGGDVAVVICPMCARSVRLVPNEDPNVTWERHVATNCDPSNYAKSTKKPKCPVPGCKEVLTFSNTVRCKACRRDTCLKHRFGPDHLCPAAARPAPAAAGGASYLASGTAFLQSLRDTAASYVGPKGGAAAPPASRGAAAPATTSGRGPAVPRTTLSKGAKNVNGAKNGPLPADPSNSVKGTAERRRQGVERVVGEHRPLPAPDAGTAGTSRGAASGTAAGGPSPARERGGSVAEECPQCGAHFPHVEELIQHVDRLHLVGTGGPRAAAPQAADGRVREICPKCGKSFGDLVELISHAEAEHQGQPSQCSIS